MIHPGTNGKMTEMSAVMGLTGLESIDEFVAANRANHQQYSSELANLPGITIAAYNPSERCNYQYAVLEVDEAVAGLSRDEFVSLLHAENILARRYFFPGCHRMEPYRSYFPNAHLLLPNTSELARRVLTLPTGTAVGAAEISLICGILRTALRHPAEIRRALSESEEFACSTTASR